MSAEELCTSSIVNSSASASCLLTKSATTTTLSTLLHQLTSLTLDDCARSLNYVLFDFWDEYQDPKTAHLPFISGGPWKVLAMVALYLFILFTGRALMKERPAYKCTKAMIWYNLANVILNLIGFLAAFMGTNFGLDVWGCKKKYFPDYLLYLGYGYLLLKFLDFFDTLFFVLRKKNNQITLLHVTHHCLMPITCYVGLKFVPYGNTGFTPLINSFVHVIMYFYYYLAALGPGMQNYLWWKKYITVVQLVQFALGIAHALQIYYVPGCEYPKPIATFELLEAIYFFGVFFNFYLKSYRRGKSDRDLKAKSS